MWTRNSQPVLQPRCPASLKPAGLYAAKRASPAPWPPARPLYPRAHPGSTLETRGT